ncbi:MAG: serine protease [Labilithrix sp.]
MTAPVRLPLGLLLSLSVVACSLSDEEPATTSTQPIVGGLEAPSTAWRGAAALYANGYQFCGGDLIADEWVITAGHCVNAYYEDTGGVDRIVIGRHSLSSSEGEERVVDHAYRHESFNWQTLDYDIGLLHLSQRSTVPPSKLLTPALAARVVEGAGVTVVGWGSTAEGSPTSDVLRQVTLPVLSNEQCRTFPHYAGVNRDQLCAGFVTGGYDACQADSGSPLFMTIDGEPYQVGIVSWGIGCARPGRPGVYTRLASYLGWVWTTTRGAAGAPPSAPAGTL